MLLSYFLCDTSGPKQSSSLTQKEKEVVSDFVSKAEKEAQHVCVALFNTVKMQHLIPLTKIHKFLNETI